MGRALLSSVLVGEVQGPALACILPLHPRARVCRRGEAIDQAQLTHIQLRRQMKTTNTAKIPPLNLKLSVRSLSQLGWSPNMMALCLTPPGSKVTKSIPARRPKTRRHQRDFRAFVGQNYVKEKEQNGFWAEMIIVMNLAKLQVYAFRGRKKWQLQRGASVKGNSYSGILEAFLAPPTLIWVLDSGEYCMCFYPEPSLFEPYGPGHQQKPTLVTDTFFVV